MIAVPNLQGDELIRQGLRGNAKKLLSPKRQQLQITTRIESSSLNSTEGITQGVVPFAFLSQIVYLCKRLGGVRKNCNQVRRNLTLNKKRFNAEVRKQPSPSLNL